MELVLSRNFHHQTPLDFSAYRDTGGYQSLEVAFQQTPETLNQLVQDSGLKGCGGGGFPAGLKWTFRPKDAPRPYYLVCNLDETEPGSFKDRQILYRDPHQIIEALVVCGYIQQADMAYVFVRGEYAEGARLLERAVKEARAAGYLGKNILGSGYDLEIDVHLSAGRYICGEETSLLNALEGRRGNPRHKPPFPAVSGLWGKPTLVNNLETFCQVPGMVKNGLDWYKSLGVNGGAGTKLYSICGPVKKPGFFELPMGTTAREIIYEQGGGLLEDRQLVGFLPGGASTQFMLPEHLDTPMHFEGPPKVGSRLGTGGFIILDSATCPIAFLINIMHFFARESCGFCTPCRDGLPFVKYLLEKIKQGKGEMSDLDLLDELCEKIYPSTFCAFAPGALMPVMSGLSHFRDVFEQRIRDKGAH